MEEVWPWLQRLPAAAEWPDSDSSLTLVLARSSAAGGKSIALRAHRTVGSNTETLVTFSILLLGFHPSSSSQSFSVWLSHPFSLSAPVLPLVRQLLQELISLAPPHPLSSIPELDVGSISAALDVCDEAPAFLQLALLCRLFWLCARDSPAEAGFILFRALDARVLGGALTCKRAAGAFLASAGADWEQRFMRSLGYVLAKWLVVCELQPSVGAPPPSPPDELRRISYAIDSHGLWVLKGYVPVPAMHRLGGSAGLAAEPPSDPKDCAIRYALAHQQLEAVVQLEYEICIRDPRYIKVGIRFENIRVHVVRLGFKDEDDDVEMGPRHVPTRVRVLVGPEVGSGYATGPSLGRSGSNREKEVELVRAVKGRVGKGGPEIRAKSLTHERTRVRKWRWEQGADGCAGVLEGLTGDDAADWWSRRGRGGARELVVAGDELAEGMTWRVGPGMKGKVVTWRVGLKVWVGFFSGGAKPGFDETRSVEWLEEIQLALVPGLGQKLQFV